MTVKDVEDAIRHGRKIINQHRDDGLLHESATRYAIIDPILRALGWKLENPKQCLVEEWRSLRDKQKVADYILLNKAKNHVVLIEAKGFAHTKLQGWTEETQLKEYALESNATIAVLTNGQSWYLYPAPWDGSFGESPSSNVYVDIYDGTTPSEPARTLHRYLNKRKLWRLA